MALQLKRSPGTSLLFQAHERTVKLSLIEVGGFAATFTIQNGKVLQHFRRKEGQVLNLDVRGEVARIHVAEVYSNTVVLRIEAPASVHIIREELIEAPK